MRIPSSLACLLTVAWCANALALGSFSAEYEISRGGFKLGQMTRHLRIDGQRYHYESRVHPRGLVSLFAKAELTESSSGHIRAGRFVPLRYRYDKGGSRKDFELGFDHEHRTVQLAWRGPAWQANTPDGVLDRLVYQAQLMLDLPAAPAALDYAIADRGKLKRYHIINAGRETVTTPLGDFETIKLQRDKPNSDDRTTVWCAATLGWIPVKVELRDDDGAVTTALLQALERED